MFKIGVVSQKGGVGKSTLAREIARQFAAIGWNVKVADLDTKQKTSVEWNAIRRERDLKPDISVEAYKDPTQVRGIEGFDLLVYDGKPHSDIETRRIAELVDLVVIPTGTTRDDLTPQIKLAYELEEFAKIPPGNILFVLNGVSAIDGPDVERARRAIIGAGYEVTTQSIPRRLAYQNAQNVGHSLSEVTHPGLAKLATDVASEIARRLTQQKEAA